MDDHTSDTIEIQLTRGYVAIIDAVDADLAKLRWNANPIDGRVYAQRKYKKPNGKKTMRGLHRIIYERIIGRPLGRLEWVDHIDNNPLNNRRSNLRLSTPSENRRNSKMVSTNQSGYKGVTPRYGKWVAMACMQGKTYHLGYFATPEAAHEAYKKFAKDHYGEFARFE